MKYAVRGMLVVALSTLLEAVRKRLLLVTVAFSLALVGLSVAIAAISIGEQARLIIDVGLAAASGLGSIIALAITISSFSGEIKNRTAYTVLVRPIPRSAFVLGKYLGNLGAMCVVVTVMIGATGIMVWAYGGDLPSALWSSGWLAYMEMALVVAVAVLFSTFASPVLAATYTTGVVIVGNLTNEMMDIGDRMLDKGNALGNVLRGFYYVVPDLQALSVRPQAANYLQVPAGFVSAGTLYGLSYAGAALLVAMWIFSRRRIL